ncbi:S1 RNA-binding domain-containing protein [Streptomyces xanthochromogenes]|uniref:S1 RNA-binding domain-containing protein n=1 Tax=Streptomyces xanthochromogenes TaxID=67384 RepID=UPI0037F714F0
MRGQAVLSLAAIQPNPWSLWADRADSVIRARVTKLVPFGILVRPDDGIAGLLHRFELPPAEPGLAARLGDEMTVRVTEKLCHIFFPQVVGVVRHGSAVGAMRSSVDELG